MDFLVCVFFLVDDKWVVCFFMENSSKRCWGGDFLFIFGGFRDGFSIVE